MVAQTRMWGEGQEMWMESGCSDGAGDKEVKNYPLFTDAETEAQRG